MRIVEKIGFLAVRAERFHDRPQVDGLHVVTLKRLEQEIVFRLPAVGLSPGGELILIDGGRIRWNRHKKARAALGQIIPHLGEQPRRFRNSRVPQNEAGALPHHFIALVKHAAASANQPRPC